VESLSLKDLEGKEGRGEGKESVYPLWEMQGEINYHPD
jgi:hypothetical protein